MSPSAQNLYFHLGMKADDDGVVEAHTVIKLTDSKPDDYNLLVAKKFIYPLNDDLVVVVLDWREHNLIRADRKIDSIYKELLAEKLPHIELLEARPRTDYKVLGTGRPMGNQRAAEDRIGQDRIEESTVSDETEKLSFGEEMQEQGYYQDASDIPNRDDVYPTVWYTSDGKRVKDSDFKRLKKEYDLRNKATVVKSVPASVKATDAFLATYAEYCQQYAGVTPVFNSKDKIIVSNALKKHGFENIGNVAQWYLKSDVDKAKKINVQSAVSTYTINQYLAKTGNKLKGHE